MKLTLFLFAMIIAKINSQIEFIYDVFDVSGTSCTSDTECDDLMTIPLNITAFWTCVNETVTQSDNTTKDVSFCQFSQCDSTADCDTNEICYTIDQCDDANEFYDDAYLLYSTICFPNTLCDDLQTDGESNTDTTCYTGYDEEIYNSEAEGILCGASGLGTCIASEQECVEDAIDCIEDKSCCTQDGWDENGCLDMLFTEYILYTVLVLVFALLCCCICCCCIYKIRSRDKDDEVDNQTNHYNVYI